MKRGLVMSDLHIFSRRSHGQELFLNQIDKSGKPDVLILNGDTFDFRWSDRGGETATLAAAEEWLLAAIQKLPDTEIHYVIGNHDCLESFRSVIEKIEADIPKFHVHELLFRWNEHLFIHGDCSNLGMSKVKLLQYRETWSKDAQRGELSKKLYRITDLSGLTKLFHWIYFPRRSTVLRTLRYLKEAFPEDLAQARQIYFGHSHRPFADYRIQNFTFHNTGSGLKGMGFLPREF